MTIVLESDATHGSAPWRRPATVLGIALVTAIVLSVGWRKSGDAPAPTPRPQQVGFAMIESSWSAELATARQQEAERASEAPPPAPAANDEAAQRAAIAGERWNNLDIAIKPSR